MNSMTKKTEISMTRLLPLVMAVAMLLTATAHAAAPGISGASFSLVASPAFITQPDGMMVYSWGYGCSGSAPTFLPSAIPNASCGTMQIPGPTLIVTEGQTFDVTLTNNLPIPAGSTSILFPGLRFASAPTGGVTGLLTQEAAHGGSVTYHLVADTPGTRSYYSGTQGDLQVEMGLYGAVVVLPNSTNAPSCPAHVRSAGVVASGASAGTLIPNGEDDFRLSPTGAAYHVAGSCYDREYLFQFSEMDPRIHRQAEEQLATIASCVSSATVVCPTALSVATEPYVPAYFMVNGRSMPDLMDSNYAPEYPHQPYNGNPHMHPGDQVLLRIIGQGRWQHPFHEHGNHVRVLARDGNLIVSATNPNSLAGPALFTTTTTPGLAIDGIFYWTGKGLNWDAYGHHDALATCTPDANGYNTSATTAINYYEWCQDHNKPMQATPTGDVGAGGPVTLPDPNIFANGAWFGGSPYLGPDATVRAVGFTGTTPPSGTVANSPTDEAGFAFMWHSHNEREITTNNIFPGGMMMMMLVDSREFVIDESK
jgi:FtsP/CotA-like multicopper oxidase with cupredoxin domain